nr:sporulation integral membrane protein YtvI [Paenibacillus sediminis]
MRGIWVILIVTVIALSVYWLMPLLYPFILAWIFAYAMNPLVRWFQIRMKMPRWLAVTLSLLLYVGMIVLIVSAAVTRLVKEVINLTQSFDSYIENFRNVFIQWTQNASIQNIINQINIFYQQNPNYQNTINNNINKTTDSVATAISNLATGFFNSILNLISSLPNVGMILIVILLAAFFLSKDWERHNHHLLRWLPNRVRKPISTIWRDLQKALFGYLRAQFIMISITTVVVIIGLIVLRVPSALAIGLMIGLVDLLPYLGVGLVMVPWIIYTFMTGNVALGIGLSILYGIILIARQIAEPKVLASSVGLDPLATLIGMFVGLKLFGALGLIIGPVSLIVLEAIRRANVFRDLRNYIIGGRVH